MIAEHGLELRGISKRYGETVAVQDLSFDVRAGELFGFVGRNGAGKTTTMRIVLGVLGADAGEVRWDGKPLDFEARSVASTRRCDWPNSWHTWASSTV
jgi:ABC-2 type transport system ATP-binding protein